MAQTCGGTQQAVLTGRAKNPTKSALPLARVASTAMGQSGRALKLQTTARHPVLCHCRSCSLIQLFCQWHGSQQHARPLSSCLDLALQFSATTGKHHTFHGRSDAPYELLEHAEQADAPTSTPSISSSIEASRAPPSASNNSCAILAVH